MLQFIGIGRGIASKSFLSTVLQTLRERGIYSLIAARKSSINPQSQAKRLAFARRYRNLTVECNLDGWLITPSSRLVFCVRMLPSVLSRTIIQTDGDGVVASCEESVSSLSFSPKRGINGKVYVLETLMGYWMVQSEDRGHVVFQKTTRLSTRVSSQNNGWKKSVDMATLPRSPNSLDLYPIEHSLRSKFQRMRYRPRVAASLAEVSKIVWNNFGADMFNRISRKYA